MFYIILNSQPQKKSFFLSPTPQNKFIYSITKYTTMHEEDITHCYFPKEFDATWLWWRIKFIHNSVVDFQCRDAIQQIAALHSQQKLPLCHFNRCPVQPNQFHWTTETTIPMPSAQCIPFVQSIGIGHHRANAGAFVRHWSVVPCVDVSLMLSVRASLQ